MCVCVCVATNGGGKQKTNKKIREDNDRDIMKDRADPDAIVRATPRA